MCRRIALLAAVVASAAGLAVPAAAASPKMLVGIYADSEVLYEPETSFPLLKTLRVQVLRVTLYWGGRLGVARRKPVDASDPNDRAYNWSLYDRTVQFAQQYGIKIMFSIYGTPAWANGGKPLNRAPNSSDALLDFAYAAATRYSGSFMGKDGRVLGPVRRWLAWNEPNNPIFLSPQYRRAGGRWVIRSAPDYAKICEAVYDGVHATMLHSEQVACGATGPRGNNSPTSSRPSVSPIAFLLALKRAGLERFDAYAHHPYYGVPSETPTKRPAPPRGGGTPTAITLANIDLLVASLSRLYGPRRLWITEYGYQTKPPDATFGVSWALQAKYLKQAYAVARRNRRVDMMLWFLLKDEPMLGGWQSGLMTSVGRKKPAFRAFQRLPH